MNNNDFENIAMKALINNQESNLPTYVKEEVEKWNQKISTADDNNLASLIAESNDLSLKEEALAREFIKRGIDTSVFLESAKFRTTKAILRKEIE